MQQFLSGQGKALIVIGVTLTPRTTSGSRSFEMGETDFEKDLPNLDGTRASAACFCSTETKL